LRVSNSTAVVVVNNGYDAKFTTHVFRGFSLVQSTFSTKKCSWFSMKNFFLLKILLASHG